MPKARSKIIKLTPDETIIRKIYAFREYKIMLDFDLAELYEVETKVLNQAVKRNIDRFPGDFMFRLTLKEWANMRSQIVTASPGDLQLISDEMTARRTSLQKKRNTGIAPYAFTEHGVTMIASVLKSERAVKMSIAVVRAFIELKKSSIQYNELSEQVQKLKLNLGEHDVQLNRIYKAIETLLEDKSERKSWPDRKRIGFKPDE